MQKSLTQSGSDGDKCLRFWRNTAVEHLALPLNYFLQLGDSRNSFLFGDYDDSFSFIGLSSDAVALEIIVVERPRVELDDEKFDRWIHERAKWLSNATSNPVLLVLIRPSIKDSLRVCFEGKTLWETTDESLLNIDNKSLTGSDLSVAGFYELGCQLGMRWIPYALGKIVKLLAVDLDDTLHEGVLGEAGLAVEVRRSHIELQMELLKAKERGMMLAILSKNEKSDVEFLLDNHPGYQLSRDDFVAIEASWDPKSQAMMRILNKSKIGPDSVVFLDDNFAELAQLKAALPDVQLVSCADGPESALRQLTFTPGFHSQVADTLGSLRTDDLKSNASRSELINIGFDAYLKSAQPVVEFMPLSEEVVERLADLSAKSNQFNVSLGRTPRERFRRSLEGDCSLMGIRVRDNFSDSGIVSGVLASQIGRSLDIEEMFVSCRALGRGLEDSMLIGAILRLAEAHEAVHARISWKRGPRNTPALTWLARRWDLGGLDQGTITVDLDKLKRNFNVPEGVQIK